MVVCCLSFDLHPMRGFRPAMHDGVVVVRDGGFDGFYGIHLDRNVFPIEPFSRCDTR